jgi:hypothetical protein
MAMSLIKTSDVEVISTTLKELDESKIINKQN